ncbi:MAG: hypothetical protein EZS28_041040 [Streblomastix strix]|uniref:Uncharacterized protein n=1 Tax=Streblomastix strix TaxID=222440 RepID=A0A5J4TZL5_9EUKA|nr:MAG: hypothetical protein EZS28_041040 [Streblomastix strix]
MKILYEKREKQMKEKECAMKREIEKVIEKLKDAQSGIAKTEQDAAQLKKVEKEKEKENLKLIDDIEKVKLEKERIVIEKLDLERQKHEREEEIMKLRQQILLIKDENSLSLDERRDIVEAIRLADKKIGVQSEERKRIEDKIQVLEKNYSLVQRENEEMRAKIHVLTESIMQSGSNESGNIGVQVISAAETQAIRVSLQKTRGNEAKLEKIIAQLKTEKDNLNLKLIDSQEAIVRMEKARMRSKLSGSTTISSNDSVGSLTPTNSLSTPKSLNILPSSPLIDKENIPSTGSNNLFSSSLGSFKKESNDQRILIKKKV